MFIQPDTSYRVGSSDTIAIIITDNDQVFPPVITVEPGDTSLLTGDVAVFKIQVSGSPPFTYQWRKNGIPTGPNSETFITPQVSMSDSGHYLIVLYQIAKVQIHPDRRFCMFLFALKRFTLPGSH